MDADKQEDNQLAGAIPPPSTVIRPQSKVATEDSPVVELDIKHDAADAPQQPAPVAQKSTPIAEAKPSVQSTPSPVAEKPVQRPEPAIPSPQQPVATLPEKQATKEQSAQQPPNPKQIAAKQPLPLQEQPPQSEQNEWQYTSGKLTADNEPARPEEPVAEPVDSNEVLVEWSASEFINHQKGTSWYVVLAIGAAILSAVIFFITKEYISIVVIMLMAVVLGVYGAAKPKVVKYTITPKGIGFGNTFHPYSEVKSFCVIKETTIPYVQLLLHKRIAVPLTLYVAPDFMDKITEIIGEYVPYDQKQLDYTDRLSAKFRF